MNYNWKDLALYQPFLLVHLICDHAMEVHDLTFAAEALGLVHDINTADLAFRRLLTHESPVVREGAVYGLASHFDTVSRERLRVLAETDSVAGVRAAAREALEG